MTATQEDQEAPAPGEYSTLLAILNQIGDARPPIPLWQLNEAGLTAAELKTALHGLAVRGCVRVTYESGMPAEVIEVYPEAGRVAALWALTGPEPAP